MTEPTQANAYTRRLTLEQNNAMEVFWRDGDPFKRGSVADRFTGGLQRSRDAIPGFIGDRFDRGFAMANYYQSVLTDKEKLTFRSQTGLT